jgi:hypothetical protein
MQSVAHAPHCEGIVASMSMEHADYKQVVFVMIQRLWHQDCSHVVGVLASTFGESRAVVCKERKIGE